jgi:hypothetical protein
MPPDSNRGDGGARERQAPPPLRPSFRPRGLPIHAKSASQYGPNGREPPRGVGNKGTQAKGTPKGIPARVPTHDTPGGLHLPKWGSFGAAQNKSTQYDSEGTPTYTIP